jgi:hypothetical protein
MNGYGHRRCKHMQATIKPNALDRVPLSLIIDDSAPLVNLNYFFIRDRNECTGQNQRWEDVPVVIPESFTRAWAEWCGENGVRGKFSVVPCPAAIGRIDQDLPLFGRKQLNSWLAMCRSVIMPNFDITPEMLTHTFILDLKTLQPLPGRPWEQYDWQQLPADEELVTEYIAFACRILANVGLTPAGVTSPGGFGGKSLALYAKTAGNAVRAATGNPTPFFFQQIRTTPPVPVPVWYADKDRGTAVGEIIACTGDWTGNWTGYGETDADKYITADLQGGCLPAMIDAGGPVVLCSHWQGFYGMHNDDHRGFHTLKTVVARLKALDPDGTRTCWRRVSEITNYACARELATITVSENTIDLVLPVQVPELTFELDVACQAVSLDGVPLQPVATRRAFRAGTFLSEGGGTLVAFDATGPRHRLEVAGTAG